jgi:CelD/BcsL family acetyltransferase involved in cellulose biosynthesis
LITEVTTYREFLSLRENWNDLLESSRENNVFLRHEWFDVWWQAFGLGKKMFILLYYDKGNLLGVAPLMIFHDRYKGTPYKRLGFIEDPNAPSMNFMVRQGEEERVIHAFLDYLLHHANRLWHVAVLMKVPNASATIAVCEDFFSQQKTRYLLRDGQNSPYIPVNSDWETFLKSTSVKFRKQLRNKINKLNGAGEVKFEVWHDAGADGKHLSDAMSASSRSWKHRVGTSMTSTPEREKFFKLLSDAASKNGWLRIWLLCLNGDPIATEYHLEYKGRTHAMRGDFDESHDALSVGSVLEAHIIEHCFKTGLLEYDFCGLPYGYKMRWTSLLHERSNLLFYNTSLYSTMLHMIQKNLPLLKQKWVALTSRYYNYDLGASVAP